jgi:flagellar motor switch protein FliG
MKSDLTGIEKIAILIRVVGLKDCAPLLKGLSPEQVDMIEEASPTGTLVKQQAIAVLSEFNKSANLVVGGQKESLMDAFDELNYENSGAATSGRRMNGFKKLSSMSAEAVYNVIKREMPIHQVIILLQMPQKLGVEVWAIMSPEEQAAFTIESEGAAEPSYETLVDINSALEERLNSASDKGESNLDKIFGFTDGMDEEQLEAFTSKLPEEIAEKIKANVLTFSHVAEQEENTLATILAGISTTNIANAFCLMEESDLERIKNALSTTKAQDVSYNIEKIVNKDDKKAISEAQRAVIFEAKRLQNEKTIEIIR